MNCMATLKHISSKNSDYTAIEAYLVYQHDAFTGKQLLDEQGKPKLRDSYLLDTLECGDFSFATACLLANRKLDLANAALTAAGQPPKQKKFETVKDTLRKQISSVLYRTTSFEEFSDRLMQQYSITVKESRGQLSYLPSGRTKFIRAKHLGDKFDKAAVLATLQANAERKQYSVEHRKPGGNGNNQHTAAAKKTAPEELCQIDTIPPTAAEASVRKQIAERNNVSESYVARSEKFMRGVEIMEQMVPGMQEKILSGQFKVRDADMHRLARADFPNRKQIVHEILHPEDRSAPQSSYSHYSGINYSALEVAVRRIQQDFDFLMRYLPKLPDDSYAKTETLKILKQHKAYMAQFEEMLNDKEIT